jgi:glycosyltransferase involved in cell wall biosynthesis
VGNVSPPKNHKFIVFVFEELLKRSPNAKLLLVGDDSGSKGEELHALVERKKLENSVIFTGVQNDVAGYLQAMDVFLLPSLWEGLSLASTEAQATGLPVLISDHVSIECKITDLVHVAELRESPSEWAEKLIELYTTTPRKDSHEKIKEAGFDIKENAIKLENYYLKKAGE